MNSGGFRHGELGRNQQMFTSVKSMSEIYKSHNGEKIVCQLIRY